MALTNKTARIIVPAIIVLTVIGGAVFLIVHHKNQIKNEKLEARFDKFMEYHYPYLENISKAASYYSRMQISLMYDYLKNNRGRYINETVPYYDGGFFSMRDHLKVEDIVEHAMNLYISHSSLPMREALYGHPSSRFDESLAWYKIILTANELRHVDIYDDDFRYNGKSKQVEETIDSLYIVIKNSLYSLSKYKNSSNKDLNWISEEEFDLNNY